MSTGTIHEATASGDPARPALIVDGRTVGYGELATAVRQCAAGLSPSRAWQLSTTRSHAVAKD